MMFLVRRIIALFSHKSNLGLLSGEWSSLHSSGILGHIAQFVSSPPAENHQFNHKDARKWQCVGGTKQLVEQFDAGFHRCGIVSVLIPTTKNVFVKHSNLDRDWPLLKSSRQLKFPI